MGVEVGQVIRYENRRCLVLSITLNKVILKNLSPVGPDDWTRLEVSRVVVDDKDNNDLEGAT